MRNDLLNFSILLEEIVRLIYLSDQNMPLYPHISYFNIFFISPNEILVGIKIGIYNQVMRTDPKIAIIDDEEDLCFLLKLSLNKTFQEIEYKHTLKEGLALFKKLKPHWLILDNNLPDALGWQHVDEFLALNSEVNIICISANPNSAVDKNKKNVHHFIKPLDIPKMKELILSK